MPERSYVPHAVTGEPVPVLTPEEKAAQEAERNSNAWVKLSGWRCYCGEEHTFRDLWQAVGDGLEAECRRGHRCLIRFIPEGLNARKDA